MQEQRFFLSVLADYLNGRNTLEPPDSLDWNELLSFGRIHQVSGIFCYQCKTFWPQAQQSEGANPSEKVLGATLYYYAKRQSMIAQLIDVLREREIPYFIIKGTAVASYYPMPAFRTMGDTDLVVHSEDRNRVHNIFLSQGYSNTSHHEDREWIYYKNGVEFELHDRLVYSEAVSIPEHEMYFNDFWKYVHDNELDWNFHMLFLILHIRKHLMNSGVGFRQFMDVAVVAQNNCDLNWELIENELKKLGMLEFAQTIFALNEKWFDLKPPIDGKTLNELFWESATDMVFRSGVFGFDDEENQKNAVINNVRECRNAYVVMLLISVRKIFPSYQNMIVVPSYGFLKGRPWMLPIAWIYRWIRVLAIYRVETCFQQFKSSFTSTERIQKRNTMLEQWGLLEK